MLARLRIAVAFQVLGRFDEHDLQGWPYFGLQQMPTKGCAIRFSDDHVGMNLRRPALVFADRNVAHERLVLLPAH